MTTETTTADCELGKCPFRHVPNCCKTCTGREGCQRRRQVCANLWVECIWQFQSSSGRKAGCIEKEAKHALG